MSRDLDAVAGGAVLSLAGRVVNGVLVFAYGIVLARMLDVESVGVMALALAVMRMAEILARGGLELGILHHVAILEGSGRVAAVRRTLVNAAGIALLLGLLMAGLLEATAGLVARAYDSPALAPVLRILALSLPPGAMALVLLGALLALRRVAANTLLEKVLWPAVNLAACWVLLAAGFGLAGASAAYGIAALVALPLAIAAAHRALPAAREDALAVPPRELLAYSLPILLVTLLTQLLGWIDTFMLGAFGAIGEVGIYSAAQRTALVASLIVGSFNANFAPRISDLYHRGRLQELEYLFKAVGKWAFLATLPLVLGILLLSDELMRLYGPEFVPGAHALSILAFTQLVGAGAGSVGYMLTMSGRQKLMILNIAASCATSVALNALLIPRFGMEGAAASTCIALAVFSVLSLVQVRGALGMHPYKRGYLGVLAAGLVAFGLVALAKAQLPPMPYIPSILAFGTAFVLAYAAGLRVMGFDREEAAMAGRLVRRILGRP